MTITSVIYVPEGIVMAADSRLTGHNQYGNTVNNYTLTDNAQKICLVRNGEVGVSFSGAAIIDNKTIADFIRIFDIENVRSDSTVTLIAQKLHHLLKNNYASYDVGFFVCGYDNDDAFIYDVSKHGAVLVNFNGNNTEYSSWWRGQLEAANSLWSKTSINFDLMPLKDALDLAEFIVELTIKYERFRDAIPTCGGPIDILVITKDYTEFYRHKILKP